ncbi:hypothetical protein DVH24_033382 [Malus domestica]|uniref:Uncharacterized protein n=1 Tax=Malus domestica TaxID=3750 RepID=A0A498JBH4_MALDO|nr:hypothetical protein DVH24_033382 [Malus domestica]
MGCLMCGLSGCIKHCLIVQSYVSIISKADSSLEPRRSSRNVEVRELHEEDFVSDEDTEEEGDDEEEIEFKSDTERVLEGRGEEEIEA